MNAQDHDGEGWLPLAAAAEILGSTPLNVLMHVKRGQLHGVEQECGWLIAPDSVATLLARRRAGEAPAVCSSGCAGRTAGCGSCK